MWRTDIIPITTNTKTKKTPLWREDLKPLSQLLKDLKENEEPIEEKPDKTVFRKTNDIPPIYQDFIKTIPIEEIEASKKTDFNKTNDIPPKYQDFITTIEPKDKYTWTEMNEMVERKIRDVVGKMTDAIKEEIVGSYSEEHANYRSLHDSHYNKEKHHPLTPDEYAQLWFSAISVFNVYLIKVLHKIVDDYKYIYDYKKYSTAIRDILDIALKNEDAFATENFPKGSSNSGTQHNMVPGDYMYAFMNVSLDKIPEYKDLMDPNNSLWAHTHVFLRNAFQTFLSLLGMMIERNIFPYNNDFASKELIVHPTHWGLLAHHGMTSNILIKNPLINHNTNKTNKPFLMRFLTIFRDFYSFLIDDIDYDVSPVKRGGKSRKRRIQKNKKTRNHKK